MNNFSKTLIASALIAGSSAVAAESAFSASANVAMTTDYVFRGLSQTNEDPAIQGGFDISHDSGFYLGVWASNVEFDSTAQSEFDIYLGIGGEAGSGLGWDVGVLAYLYPGSEGDDDGGDTVEWYGKLSYSFGGDLSPTVGFGIAYSDDFYLLGDGLYISGSIDLSLPSDFAIGASVGDTNIDADGFDYTDWKVYISKEVGGFGFELAYTDTDIDDCTVCDGRAIFTVSKSF